MITHWLQRYLRKASSLFTRLPEYPWQQLAPYREIAAKHPEGSIDLSVGSPVDGTPEVIQAALLASSNAPGYPSTSGTQELKKAIVNWFATRRRVPGLKTTQVIPTIGSKEFIAWLPLMLGMGPSDVLVQPRVAYTAYEVGAKFAGCELVSTDDPEKWPENTKLVWLNSPSNPDGKVASYATLRKAVDRARELGAVLASDECYAELGWLQPWEQAATPCLLEHEVTGGDMTNLIAIYSLSKQSNLAGYRAALAAGDESLISEILNLRMHAGLMTPFPVQQAMIAGLSDYSHVAEEKSRYRLRRERLMAALEVAGFRIESSEAGLYIWLNVGTNCFEAVEYFANLGIIVVPGTFYGPAASENVRVSVTATDEDIDNSVLRLENAIGWKY